MRGIITNPPPIPTKDPRRPAKDPMLKAWRGGAEEFGVVVVVARV